MGGFIENFKRGLAGDEKCHYSVAGVRIRCPHCGGEDFDTGTAPDGHVGSGGPVGRIRVYRSRVVG
jgi:hypothetical protein